MKKLLYKNSIVGVIQVLLTTILTFVGIHFLISKLGVEEYGVFALISVIGNLNIFANLGLNFSLIKFISEQGDSVESNWDIIISIVILSIIIIPLSILFMLFGHFIMTNILNVPTNYIENTKQLYNFLLLSNILMLIGQLFSSVFDAIQKIYITNFLQMIYSTLYWVLIIVVLALGYSLGEIGICIFISTLVWFILTLYFFVRLWGRLKSKGIFSQKYRLLRKHFNYGSKIYLSGTLNFFYEPLTKLLISNFLSINYVGYFDIALKIRTIFLSFISKILYPLYPYIANLNDKVKISNLVNDIQKKLLYAVIIITAIVFGCTYQLIQIWIGQNVNIISISVISIITFFMLNITGMPNYQYLMTHQVSKTLVFQFANVIINITTFMLLYKLLGYYAILVSFNLSMLLTFVLTLYYQRKYLNSFMFDSLHYIYRLALLFVVLFSIAILSRQIDNIVILIINPILIIVSSLIIFRYFNYFTVQDIEKYISGYGRIENIVKKLLIKNRKILIENEN